LECVERCTTRISICQEIPLLLEKVARPGTRLESRLKTILKRSDYGGRSPIRSEAQKPAFLFRKCRFIVARPGRFERPTLCFGGTCSIQLSYERVVRYH
jgi:hypothetical protein